uniref:Uncharacterized protein n=1 Tax=Cacopsylla melanoneura TaxID=428564 RepID=A0A8D9F631_9HEMI
MVSVTVVILNTNFVVLAGRVLRLLGARVVDFRVYIFFVVFSPIIPMNGYSTIFVTFPTSMEHVDFPLVGCLRFLVVISSTFVESRAVAHSSFPSSNLMSLVLNGFCGSNDRLRL